MKANRDAKRGFATLRPTVPGLIGAAVLGLFIAAMAFEGFVACLFGQGLLFVGMLAGFALAWWATRRITHVQLRIVSRAALAGILFTPYVPTASIQWSSPWPPASFWLIMGSGKPNVIVWTMTLVCVATGLLWAAGWGVHLGRQPGTGVPEQAIQLAPDAPLKWPEHFPPTSGWLRFTVGFPGLGPDLSFFKFLNKQQAGRTGAVMTAWHDARQRHTAEVLGKYFQRETDWKTRWFLPSDACTVVLSGGSFGVWSEVDVWDLFCELEEELGTHCGPEWWNGIVRWDEKQAPFGELVRRVAEELSTEKIAPVAPGEGPAQISGQEHN